MYSNQSKTYIHEIGIDVVRANFARNLQQPNPRVIVCESYIYSHWIRGFSPPKSSTICHKAREETGYKALLGFCGLKPVLIPNTVEL